MSTSLTTALVASCLLSAMLLGMWLRRFIPEHHLSTESRDTVKLTMGLVATMTALLLSLLVNSARTTYDTTQVEVMQKAAKYILIDRVLDIYGASSAQARSELRTVVEMVTAHLWPDDGNDPVPMKLMNQQGNTFYTSILKLEPRDEAQGTLKAQAASLAIELGQITALMEAQSTVSISTPMLVVVVLWLVVIFLGFTLISPPNTTANFALIASATCATGAIFLILELDLPFSGLLRIPSEPMLKVLREIGQ
jgi:hypothetical protein